MQLLQHLDTTGSYAPETLYCVLRLLGVKNPPQHLRGYAEALGAGIAVQAEDLILRCSWFALDKQGRCTAPCTAPAEWPSSRFQYYPLGKDKSILVYPHLGCLAETIVTPPPGSGAGQPAEQLCPKGSAILRETFQEFRSKERCALLWGQATMAVLPPFPQTAAVLCGKPLVRGIGRLLGMDTPALPGATGDVDTDLEEKTTAALAAAQTYPFVLLHINGADEASHRKNVREKQQFLQRVDQQVLARLLSSKHEIIVASDHGTDPQTGLHSGAPQPVWIRR